MADAHKVIATAGIITVSVGTVNAVARNHTLPSTRFLIGSGVVYLILSAMAEAEPEIAKALSVAVMTTVLLGEGGGVLSYLNQRGEMDTHKRPQSGFTPKGELEPPGVEATRVVGLQKSSPPFTPDTITPIPNL